MSGGSVQHSVLFRNVLLQEGSSVSHSILLDGVQVGAGAKLKNCILDKNVCVPAGEVIGYDPLIDNQRFTFSKSGVVVVPKNYQFTPTSNGRVDIGDDDTVVMDDTVTIEATSHQANTSRSHQTGDR